MLRTENTRGAASISTLRGTQISASFRVRKDFDFGVFAAYFEDFKSVGGVGQMAISPID